MNLVENIEVSEITPISAKVEWEKIDIAEGYRISVAEIVDEEKVIVDSYNDLDLGDINTIVLSGLKPDTQYGVQVKAYNKFQETDYSELVVFTTDEATFDMLLTIAKHPLTKAEDIPETIVIISDMQIDSGSYYWRQSTADTEMEKIRQKWNAAGFKCPKLVYWNVNASKNTILDNGTDVTFVSGCSPVIFEQVLTGVTGYQLMLDKLMSKRDEAIK